MSRYTTRWVGTVLLVVVTAALVGGAAGADSSLTATFHTYDGEVAQGDPIIVDGDSEATDDVVLVFVGGRGHLVTALPHVTSNGSFRARGIDLDGMPRGEVTALAVANGDDLTFGDGSAEGPEGREFPTETAEEFASFAEAYAGEDLTGSQIVRRLRSNSAGEAGSDDSLVEERFRVTGARTTIRDAVPLARPNLTGINPVGTGETMVVRGTTNRNPRETTIALQVVAGPATDRFTGASAQGWGTDGVWQARLAVPADADPGSYRLRADDGVATTTTTVEVVAERSTPTPTPAPPTTAAETSTPTRTATTHPPRTPTPTAVPPTPASTPVPTVTEGGGQGLGFLAAILALGTLAVLAVRR